MVEAAPIKHMLRKSNLKWFWTYASPTYVPPANSIDRTEVLGEKNKGKVGEKNSVN